MSNIPVERLYLARPRRYTAQQPLTFVELLPAPGGEGVAVLRFRDPRRGSELDVLVSEQTLRDLAQTFTHLEPSEA